MIKRDYYEVLGIDRGSDETEIKKAYRRLAMEYHPDRNPGHDAEEKFKEASEAYEVLSDSGRRQIYDAYGHQGLEGSGFHGFTDVSDIFSSMGSIFEEFFGGMGFGMGGRGGRRGGQLGADLRHDLTITFEEAARGASREVSIVRQTRCGTCEGSGMEPGTGRNTCLACAGTGQVAQRQGFFVLSTPCPSCHGAGSKIDKACGECRGQGRVRQSRKLAVKIPPGIEDGMQLILRGEGEAGERGGPSGDLYVFIRVKPHDFFARQGNDLVCVVPISFPQAALGATITVPTLDAEDEIAVPAGTETGDELRLKGRGFADVHGRRRHGDQIIRIVVKTPRKLSKKQRELLEEFARS